MQGWEFKFTVSPNVEVDLSSNSLSHGVTVGALAHAVWALTLSIYHRTDDVLFAAAFSGGDAEIEGILALDGPTLCVVPKRIGLEQSLTVLDFVRNVQTNHLWRLSNILTMACGVHCKPVTWLLTFLTPW